ncbi:MAG: VanZ family protein [Floccifex sp.]
MKKHYFLRFIWFVVFVCAAVFVITLMYSMSSEDGYTSSIRSENVTEALKQEVKTYLESSPEGFTLSQKIKSYIILYSPYGSNWNTNIRKIAHFMIYFCMAIAIYFAFTILGIKKGGRFFLTILICFFLACGDEWHQGSVAGRTMSKIDVLIDTLGAMTSVCICTVLSLFFSLFKKIFD